MLFAAPLSSSLPSAPRPAPVRPSAGSLAGTLARASASPAALARASGRAAGLVLARGSRPWLAPLAQWLQRRTGAPFEAANDRQAPDRAGELGLAGQERTGRSAASAAPVRPQRALRVLHVVEPGTPGGTGRMVISGRMADVCAELDRLAEHEACAGQAPTSRWRRGGL